MKLKEIMNAIYKSQENIYKLKAGQGDWYSISKNGTVIFEGNRNYIKNILKKFTNYNYIKIEQVINDSLTAWIELKLKKEI